MGLVGKEIRHKKGKRNEREDRRVERKMTEKGKEERDEKGKQCRKKRRILRRGSEGEQRMRYRCIYEGLKSVRKGRKRKGGKRGKGGWRERVDRRQLERRNKGKEKRSWMKGEELLR